MRSQFKEMILKMGKLRENLNVPVIGVPEQEEGGYTLAILAPVLHSGRSVTFEPKLFRHFKRIKLEHKKQTNLN